ncbi:MAG: nucleotidyltransferase domain-containing protein [Candidatus Aenigmatarchaeota archaeon]
MSKKVGNASQNSGLTRKQADLLKIFAKEPWKSFTVSEIRIKMKSKSHHYMYGAINVLERKKILKAQTTGKTQAYAVDYENDNNANYLALAEHAIKEERQDIPFSNLKQITDFIKSPFYVLVVGGSYAEGKQKTSSDIDVAIIVPDCESKKPFEAALMRGELIIPEVHGFVFTREEFYRMLVNSEYNFGKELARKHILVGGAEAYYKILFEAMKHGFKG